MPVRPGSWRGRGRADPRGDPVGYPVRGAQHLVLVVGIGRLRGPGAAVRVADGGHDQVRAGRGGSGQLAGRVPERRGQRVAERDGAHPGGRGPGGQRAQGVAGPAGAGQHRDPDGHREGAGRVLVRGAQDRGAVLPGQHRPRLGLIADGQEAAGAMPIRVAVSRAGLALSSAVAGTWYGMTAGKIRPAGQVRQRLPISQAASCCCCPRLNVRGSTCSTTEPADTPRPISASTKPARTSR